MSGKTMDQDDKKLGATPAKAAAETANPTKKKMLVRKKMKVAKK